MDSRGRIWLDGEEMRVAAIVCEDDDGIEIEIIDESLFDLTSDRDTGIMVSVSIDGVDYC